MKLKFSKFKKFISVAIICTMIAAMFMPTISVQAAEESAIEQVVENYTDIENSEYTINSVTREYDCVYVNYSAPNPCRLVIAEYDGLTEIMNQVKYTDLSAATDGEKCFYLSNYDNQNVIVKLFLVDYNNRPLGKAFSQEFEIGDYSETPSLGWDCDMEPHPTAALKNDSGKFAYGVQWAVDTDGVLTISGGYTFLYSSGENIVPWNEYREGITSIVMSEGMTDVGQHMFQGLNRVKTVTVPARAYIYEDAFSDMASLETVVLSFATDEYGIYSPTNVSGETFKNCPSLKNFIVDENDELYMTIDGVLYSKDGSCLIKYPSGRTDKTFVIPDSVEYIGSYAFEGAANLEKIVVGDNVTDIENNAFASCSSLKEVDLPYRLDNLSYNAFYNCPSLKNLVIPDSLRYIDSNGYDSNCFEGFDGTALEGINIPLNLNSDSFNDFSSMLPGTLKTITVSEENQNFAVADGALYSADMTTLYRYIGGMADTSFTVPDSVTAISEGAFRNCKNLKNIEIGSSVKSIGKNAFEGCSNLTDISLTNVTDINYDLFKNCNNLKNIELGSVENLYRGAFYGCKSLESITIPASVNYIDDGMFINCDSLENIILAEGNTRYSINDGCLYENTILKEYPNAKSAEYTVSSETTEIAASAFEGRTALKSIIIPDSVESIGERAFAECSSLTEVSLPENLKYIYEYAFYDCTALPSIKLPASLDNVSFMTFGNCKSLKSIEFPETEQTGSLCLSSRAFSNCGLENVTIPKSVSLDYIPFYGCYSLKSVKFESKSDYWGKLSYIFWNVDDLTIYYPEGDPAFSSSFLHNYQHEDSLKFIAYDAGNLNCKGSYTFKNLTPNSTYLVGLNDGAVSENMLDSPNLLYLDQFTSDNSGKITVDYKIRKQNYTMVPFVIGEAKYNIENAQIEIGETIYGGLYQDKPNNYTVTYNGKMLEEGVDYLVTDNSGFYETGTHLFTIVGIGNYYGTANQEYEVLCVEYDVNGDGVVNIKDTTAIQFYLAGIRTPQNLDAADANSDGRISVEDVTHIQKVLAGIF